MLCFLETTHIVDVSKTLNLLHLTFPLSVFHIMASPLDLCLGSLGIQFILLGLDIIPSAKGLPLVVNQLLDILVTPLKPVLMILVKHQSVSSQALITVDLKEPPMLLTFSHC